MIRFAVSLALVVSSLFVSEASSARSLDPATFTKHSVLTEFSFDPDLGDGRQRQVVGGSISVNAVKKEVVLLLHRRSNCPPNRLCPAMLPPPIVIRAKIVKSTVEKCNVAIYLAQVDERATGGNLEALRIVDNSKNMCLANAVSDQDLTAVTHKTVSSSINGTVKTFTSNYYGTALVQRAAPNRN